MPVGLFWPILSLLLDNSYRIAEGHVICADNGGIDLRNNTLPVELDLGVTGKEVLFGSSLRLFVRKTALRTLCLRKRTSCKLLLWSPQRSLEDNGAFAPRNWAFQDLAGTYTDQFQA
jgi:hypothetical protein